MGWIDKRGGGRDYFSFNQWRNHHPIKGKAFPKKVNLLFYPHTRLISWLGGGGGAYLTIQLPSTIITERFMQFLKWLHAHTHFQTGNSWLGPFRCQLVNSPTRIRNFSWGTLFLLDSTLFWSRSHIFVRKKIKLVDLPRKKRLNSNKDLKEKLNAYSGHRAPTEKTQESLKIYRVWENLPPPKKKNQQQQNKTKTN